jgi:hypothetical protein
MPTPLDRARSHPSASILLAIALCTAIATHPTPSTAQAGKPLAGELRWAQIHQIIRDKVTAIPLFEQAFIWGVGPRAPDAGDGRIPGFGYSAPFEDLKLK